MDPLRVSVTRRGTGYIAASLVPEVMAVGSTADQAAENVRRTALKLFDKHARPTAMIVRFDEPGRSIITVQPLEKPVSPEWCYFSVVSPEDAHELA
jgi:hypothetical protein